MSMFGAKLELFDIYNGGYILTRGYGHWDEELTTQICPLNGMEFNKFWSFNAWKLDHEKYGNAQKCTESK